MEVEQKPFTQKKPQQLVYLELGSGNGGMLLSLSEEGFRFRAVSPVRTDGPLLFAFSLDGINRLEGTGEIESLEDDGKSGGLRFTEVSDEFRGKLSSWLSTDSSAHFTGREVTPAAAVPLDTMEKIRAEIRAGSAVSPRQPQSAAPVSATPASVNPAHSEKRAPVIPAGKIPERVIPDHSVIEKPSAQSPANQLPVTRPPVTPRPTVETRAAVRPAAVSPIIDRIKPDPNLKPVFSERLPEPEDTPNTASRLFPQAPPNPQETEKPAALSSAFLKLARETKAPAGTPVAPVNSAPPVAQKLPAKSVAPVRRPASSVLFAPHTPSALVVNVPPEEPPVTEQPRRYVPALDVSLDMAWENAKLSAPSEPPHLSRAAAGGIILIALAVILGALAFNFRQEIGTIFIQLGQRISGGNGAAAPAQDATPENQPGDAQNTTPASPQPEAQPKSGPANSSNTSKAASALPVTNSAETPGGDANKKAAATNPGAMKSPSSNTARETSKPAEKPQEITPAENPADGAAKTEIPAVTGIGQEEFDAAREILRGKNRAQELSRAVELLWAAVKKGNVPAEVTLGDLYRRGDGVEKSCDQARVLLVAASKKGSADARKQLEQMAEQGCE